MNSILKRAFGNISGLAPKTAKRKRPKTDYPLTFSYNEKGEFIGEGIIDGAKCLNIVHWNGKTTVKHL